MPSGKTQGSAWLGSDASTRNLDVSRPRDLHWMGLEDGDAIMDCVSYRYPGARTSRHVRGPPSPLAHTSLAQELFSVKQNSGLVILRRERGGKEEICPAGCCFSDLIRGPQLYISKKTTTTLLP